jgi:hypothetical protein
MCIGRYFPESFRIVRGAREKAMDLTGTHRHAGSSVHVAKHGTLSYRGGSLLGKALEKLGVVGFSFLQHGFKSRRGHWKPALMALPHAWNFWNLEA